MNYEFITNYQITYFFPLKVIQRQRIYLQRRLYKPRNSKIRNFIFKIDKIVEYLEKFPPFGINKGLHEYDILELVNFLIPR